MNNYTLSKNYRKYKVEPQSNIKMKSCVKWITIQCTHLLSLTSWKTCNHWNKIEHTCDFQCMNTMKIVFKYQATNQGMNCNWTPSAFWTWRLWLHPKTKKCCLLRIHSKEGRHQSTSESNVRFTSCLLRCPRLIDFWRRHRCVLHCLFCDSWA